MAGLPYGEVIVYDNSREAEDLKFYANFEAAKRATRKIIYFQDSDLIFREHDALLEAYTPGKLVSNMSRDWCDQLRYWDLAFTGPGSLIDKEVIEPTLQRYLDVYPKDELFLHEAAMIFGVLVPYVRIDLGFEVLPAASNDNVLWKQDWHQRDKWTAANRARELRTTCLCMMVKDEAEYIEQALRSTAGLYDQAMILDTGSTDDTVKIAEGVLGDLGVPTLVRHEPFVDFATSRNISLELARKSGCDFLMLMDGDETWTGHGNRRLHLERDCTHLEYDQDLSIPQPRIIRAWQPWEYRGRRHATLYCDELFFSELREQPKIQHYGAVRHVGEKLRSDLVELREMHFEDPTDSRTVFLLAKCLEGVGQLEEAAALYYRRTQMGGWDEEVFYAQYKYGALLAVQGSFSEGVDALLKAWRMRPYRAEPLHTLSVYCEDVCSQLSVPKNELLFVQRSWYGQTT